jgi:hypothetical protein
MAVDRLSRKPQGTSVSPPRSPGREGPLQQVSRSPPAGSGVLSCCQEAQSDGLDPSTRPSWCFVGFCHWHPDCERLSLYLADRGSAAHGGVCEVFPGKCGDTQGLTLWHWECCDPSPSVSKGPGVTRTPAAAVDSARAWCRLRSPVLRGWGQGRPQRCALKSPPAPRG